MNEDTRKVEVRHEGIFIVGERKLSLSTFKARRTRLEGQILDLQNEQRNLEHQIKKNSQTIQQLESELATFNSPEAIEWMERREHELVLQRERKRKAKIEANQRARQFLREYIGEKPYNQLNKKGFIEFQGKDHQTYRIDRKGGLYRHGKRLCMIHPRNLPLPDFIVGILTTVKEVGRRT